MAKLLEDKVIKQQQVPSNPVGHILVYCILHLCHVFFRTTFHAALYNKIMNLYIALKNQVDPNHMIINMK